MTLTKILVPIVAVMAVILIMQLMGVFESGPRPAPAPAPAPPPDYIPVKTNDYINSVYGLSVKYPQDWIRYNVQDVLAAFESPDGKFIELVNVVDAPNLSDAVYPR